MTKPRYTLAQHEVLGSKLAWMCDTLVHEYVSYANAYPNRGSKNGDLFKKAKSAVFQLRMHLQNLVASEGHENATHVYSPLPEDRHPEGIGTFKFGTGKNTS